MIKRYLHIFSASFIILFTPTSGVKANIKSHLAETFTKQISNPSDGFNYQAVLRDSKGNSVVSSDVTVRFSLSNSTGDVWIETHAVTTNAYGMVSAVIGTGSKAGGSVASFSTIDWSTNLSIKVEADSGTGFVELGTSTLQSVPYANYAKNGLTSAQVAEINANTAKIGITTAQAAAITANTNKAGITPEQVTAISNISGTNTGDQDISGIATNAAAIALNTAKTGVTGAQSAAITANTAKTGISSAQANAITANTAKAGVSLAQAIAINDNTIKIGLTAAQITLLENTSGTNSGDQDISGIATNATAIALNTAKTGITAAQASAITANTAKVGGAFSTTTNITSGGDADDDFVFGAAQLINVSGTADDSRMFFDKSKGAFRAGVATGTHGNTPGDQSFASGYNTIATGDKSVALGHTNTASGSFSSVLGGANNTASGASAAVVNGQGGTASGSSSVVGGGVNNAASGSNSTISGGSGNTASAFFSAVGGGRGVNAQAHSEFAIGQYSSNATSPNTSSFIATDRLFTIGNGTADNARSNAMTVLKNGNTSVSGTLAVGATSSHGSAALDIASTSKGFLPPRLTFDQREAITGPVAGLVIWCRDCSTPQLQVFNGTVWTDMIGGTALTNSATTSTR